MKERSMISTDASWRQTITQEGGGPIARADDLYATRIKSAIDKALAGCLLVLTSPLLLLAVALVKLTSPGPVIYSQRRVGRGGRNFTIYKVRSMTYNCERTTGPRWSTGRDSRVTPVGRFLRRTHLDELPQLWNVLRGDMSLVGPRPERPEFVTQLAKVFPDYMERLAVAPGLTGLAQVQLPPDSDVEGVGLKLSFDLYYVGRVGFLMDVRVLLGTIPHVLGCSYEFTRKLLRFPSLEVIQGEVRGGTLGVPKADEVPVEPAPASRPEFSNTPDWGGVMSPMSSALLGPSEGPQLA